MKIIKNDPFETLLNQKSLKSTKTQHTSTPDSEQPHNMIPEMSWRPVTSNELTLPNGLKQERSTKENSFHMGIAQINLNNKLIKIANNNKLQSIHSHPKQGNRKQVEFERSFTFFEAANWSRRPRSEPSLQNRTSD